MTALAPPDLPDLDVRAARLRDPLIAELRRPRHPARPRRRRPALALALATGLALVLVVTGGLGSRDAAPALAVEHQDGWLVLRIADVAAGEAALTRELQDAGVAGEVRLLPVESAEVGSWAVIAELADPRESGSDAPTAPGPPEVVRLDRVVYARDTLRVPIAELRESTGWFIFYAGREARPGEELRRDGDLRFSP